MTDLRATKTLLDELTRLYPPPSGKNHAILLRTDGEEGLMLMVHVGSVGHTFTLDEDDLSKAPEGLAEEINRMVVGLGFDKLGGVS